MKAVKIIFPALLTFFALYVSGCKDDASTEPANPPEEKYAMAPPAIAKVNLSYVPDGQYVANITWDASKDENNENFTGYAVVTYGVDYEGNRNTESPYYDSAWVISKSTHSYMFGFLERGKLYRTKVYSISFSKIYSEAVKSETYGITEITPPVQAVVNLDQASSPYAIINWSASRDEAMDDFVGYAAATYEVTSLGTKISMFDSVVVNKPSHNHIVSGFSAGKLYKSYIWSLLDNGDHSIPLETNTYAAIVKGSGEIDEMYNNANAKSGFGWNIAGVGAKYQYSSVNAASIDIHCKKAAGSNSYELFSPASVSSPLTGAKDTKFASLSYNDWDKSFLPMEPNLNRLAITTGDVILLRNQDGYYIKLKIKSIATAGSNSFATITFEYKFQTMQGLRAAKQ